ncbi:MULTISPECIES: UL36 very large tegument protein [unclassified Streptomyces]|uniref:UL36 very large tegument protein n=1 Tax=unclassified Streptomyces TaxID=2593676 RepID=UPI002B1CCBAD|nr:MULTISPECIES: UL36 very large tegument protein [unclassified Streptomyces]
MTQRLDPGAGWYGEFLRRDREGLRACVDGVAMPPWDVVESLLWDAGADAREAAYAARLRAAAVTAWDMRPGGTAELRTLLAAAAAQRAASETTLRHLTDRLAATPPDAAALSRELTWAQDDATRAAARHADLTARLTAATPAPPGGPAPGRTVYGPPAPQDRAGGGSAAASPEAGAGPAPGPEPDFTGGELPGAPQRPMGNAEVAAPVGRAEGRWLRGGRRAGGARYAGSAAPDAPAFTPPPGHPAGGAPVKSPRGARFAPPDNVAPDPDLPAPPGEPLAPPGGVAPEPVLPAPRGARFGPPRTGVPEGGLSESRGALFGSRADAAGGGVAPEGGPSDAVGWGSGAAGETRGLVAALGALRAQGRGGEAHVLLCEAAAGPAAWLPGLAEELGRAGLAADWATLLWEAASLPPERLAAAAAALGEAGRHADCDALLRQGAARPTAEIADAAQALATAGRAREADALLGAFVRVRTPAEAAALARRAPQWFAPRLLRAARAVSASSHGDLVHAFRVAGIVPA